MYFKGIKIKVCLTVEYFTQINRSFYLSLQNKDFEGSKLFQHTPLHIFQLTPLLYEYTHPDLLLYLINLHAKIFHISSKFYIHLQSCTLWLPKKLNIWQRKSQLKEILSVYNCPQFHLFQHRELKNFWILNQMICQVCKSSYFNYFS